MPSFNHPYSKWVCCLQPPSFFLHALVSDTFTPVTTGDRREQNNERSRLLVNSATVLAHTNIQHNMASTQPQEVPEALLMTLPAELRNEIYQYVLDDEAQKCKTRFKVRFTSKGQARDGREERALLNTSSVIRAESLPMFYSINKFELTFAISQFHDAAEWVSSLRRQCGNGSQGRGPLGGISLNITTRSWNQVASLFPLAEFAFQYASVLGQVKPPAGMVHLSKTVHDIAALGRKANKQDKDLEWLKMRFEQVVSRHLGKKHARTALSKGEVREEMPAEPGKFKEVDMLGGPVEDSPRQTRLMASGSQ